MPKAPKTHVGKSNKVVHPNSRLAASIQKHRHHDQKVLKSKADTSVKNEQLRQKLLWFQENMDQNKRTYTKHELAELTCSYLERFEEELEQIGIISSVGNRQAKQHVSRETAIRLSKEREKQEFEEAGIEVPDLVNGRNLEYFRNWTGEVNYFQNMKFRKSKLSDIETVSEDDEAEESDEEELPEYCEESDVKAADSNKTNDDLPEYVDESNDDNSLNK